MIFLRNLRLKPFQCFLYKIRSSFLVEKGKQKQMKNVLHFAHRGALQYEHGVIGFFFIIGVQWIIN